MVRPWAKGQRNIGDTSSAIKLFADWKKSRCWQQHKTKRECKTVMFLFKLSLTDVCFWNMTFFSGWANAGVLACFSSPGMHVFTKTKWFRLQEPDPITFAIKIRMPILAKNINYKNRWVYYRNITKYISTIQYPFSEKKTWARLHKTDFWTNNSTLLVEFLFHWIVGNHRKEFPPSRKPWRGAGTLVDGRSPAPSWYGEWSIDVLCLQVFIHSEWYMISSINSFYRGHVNLVGFSMSFLEFFCRGDPKRIWSTHGRLFILDLFNAQYIRSSIPGTMCEHF